MILPDASCEGDYHGCPCGDRRQAVGVDIEPNSVTAAANRLAGRSGPANLAFVEADISMLPFEDEAFDAVFFHAVLYHQSQGGADEERCMEAATGAEAG